MNPAIVFCPNIECPARGQRGEGNISVHPVQPGLGSQQEKRYQCEVCNETFAATKGTLFYRLRTDPKIVIQVNTLLAYGCPRPAVVAAFGLDERTQCSTHWTVRCRNGGNVRENGAMQFTRMWLGKATWICSKYKPMRSKSRRNAARSGWRWP